MHILTLVLSFLSILATALPLSRSYFWWIRIFDYPRVQIAVLCVISLILVAVFLESGTPKTALLLLVFGSLVYQIVFIFPYTSFGALQSERYEGEPGKSTFSILEANIKMNNHDAEGFLALVAEKDPDLVVITEPDKWWDEKLESLNDSYPHSIRQPLENTYGMILYSRFPLKDTQINYLVEDGIPSFYAKVVLADGHDFDLYTLHPRPPRPGSSTYDRDTEILLVGHTIRKAKRPAVVVGDLNDVGWSYTSQLFQRYSRMLDPRRGRGFFNTYNVFVPLFRYPLDHFFHSKHFGLVKIEKLRSIGSDHYPMLIVMNLNPDQPSGENLPEADQEDKEQVKETLEGEGGDT